VRRASLGLALCLGAASVAAAEPPHITKVEPPSWWAGHTLDPVRLLIRGEHLEGARVVDAGPGLRAGSPRVSAAGTHAFVDVAIDPHAAPGMRRIRIETAAGRSEAPFEIVPSLPLEGRFQGFSQDDVIYLVMPDRFANGDRSNDDPPRSRGLLDRSQGRYYHGGDLEGIIDHLPYLEDLGVTALWINPVYDNSDELNRLELHDGKAVTDYHGYGAIDFYGVDEHLGDMKTLRALVDAAHRMGLKVIQDQVANHTGPRHPWVDDPPTPTWFNGSRARHLSNAWQTWTLVDPHATPEVQAATLSGWFIDLLPDLNQDDPDTARYLIQNSLWWVGMTGFDGIRQDTLPYVPRRFWSEWSAALHREYPHLRIIGEMWDANAALVSYFQGGVVRDGIDSGIDALFDFPAFFPLRRAFAEGKPLRELAATLGLDRLYPDPASLVTFAGLHDVPRFVNETGATADGLRLAFTFLMSARGIPMIYYGDEIALPGAGDPDNRRDFPGGWSGDSRNAFTAQGRTSEEQAVFSHVRRLTRLRAELPALRRGRQVNLAVDEQSWVYARILEGSVAVVALNNGTDPATLEFGVATAGLADGVVLRDRAGTGPDVRVAAGRLRITLPPRSGVIYEGGPRP
jgi:glycosidase